MRKMLFLIALALFGCLAAATTVTAATSVRGIVVARNAERNVYVVAQPSERVVLVRTHARLRLGDRVRVSGVRTGPGTLRALSVHRSGRGGRVILHGRVAHQTRRLVQITTARGAIQLRSSAQTRRRLRSGQCIAALAVTRTGVVSLLRSSPGAECDDITLPGSASADDECNGTPDRVNHENDDDGDEQSDGDAGQANDEHGNAERTSDDGAGQRRLSSDSDDDDGACADPPNGGPIADVVVTGRLTVNTTTPATISVRSQTEVRIFTVGSVDVTPFSTGQCVIAGGIQRQGVLELVSLLAARGCP